MVKEWEKNLQKGQKEGPVWGKAEGQEETRWRTLTFPLRKLFNGLVQIFGRIQGLLLLNRIQEEKLLGDLFKSERMKLKFYI